MVRLNGRGTVAPIAAAVIALACGAVSAETIEVKRGDTFSAIASRITGDARLWRRLYDPKLSQLPDPNFIVPGMRFELTEEAGKRYLKLVAGGYPARMAAAEPAAAPPTPATAPAAPKVASPAPAAAPAPATTAATKPAEPLVVGVLPNIAASALMAQYDNAKAYFDKRTNQRLNIVLPANFKAFFDAMMRGDYDVAVSAPHFARIAQLDAGMVPLATYEPRIAAQFIVPIDSTTASPADVRGKTVAFANPTSLVALYGQQWLRASNLEPARDYNVTGARSDLGVGRMLLTGEAAAAIMSNGEFRALPQEEAVRLRIVEVFARIPNFIVLGHPRLGAARLSQIKRDWLGLFADKEDGAAFAKATGFTGIVEVNDATLRELDAYVAPTRKAMGLSR